MTSTLPTARAPRVSILVIAARHGHHLRACLQALARNVPARLGWELVLLLNRADPDVASAALEFSGLEVESSAVDLGLAGGLNRARAMAKGEFLVVLHDDTEVEPGWLEALVEVAERHPEAGAVGSWVLNMDRSSQHLGAVVWSDGGAHHSQPADRGGLLAVDYTGSSSMLVRRSSWDRVGGAGEEFFPAFYVDVDLAFKIWECGEAVLATQASRLLHQRSASTSAPFRAFLLERHREVFRAKWQHRLALHEPRGDSSAAVRRALERAAERWRSSAPAVSPVTPLPLDAREQERRLLERAADVQRDWARTLEERWQAALADLARLGTLRESAVAGLQTELDCRLAESDAPRSDADRLARELAVAQSQLAGLRGRLATLAAMEDLRWWRLYRRVLPALRVLRALSRRRDSSRTE